MKKKKREQGRQEHSLSLQEIIPQRNEHSVLFGMTESGKTTLAEFLINAYAHRENVPFVVVLDTKGKIKWKGYHVITSFSQLIETKYEKVIYYPNVHEQFDLEVLDNFFKWIFLRENTILYVDETSSVAESQKIPFHYKGCLARGRELNITVFSSTQRPKGIPAIIISESANKYVFRLQLEGDRKRVKEFTGITDEDISRLPRHCFYYANLLKRYGPLSLDISPEVQQQLEQAKKIQETPPPAEESAAAAAPVQQPGGQPGAPAPQTFTEKLKKTLAQGSGLLLPKRS